MAAEHTRGKLWLKPTDYTTIEAHSGEPDSPYVVAKTHTSPFAPLRTIAVANARRLVACWNACQGISTEALEQGAAEGNLAEIAKALESPDAVGAAPGLAGPT